MVYEVDPLVGRVGQAVRAWSLGSVTSSTASVSMAWAPRIHASLVAAVQESVFPLPLPAGSPRSYPRCSDS